MEVPSQLPQFSGQPLQSDEIIIVNSPQDFLQYFPEGNTSNEDSLPMNPMINTVIEGPGNIMKELIIFNPK